MRIVNEIYNDSCWYKNWPIIGAKLHFTSLELYLYFLLQFKIALYCLLSGNEIRDKATKLAYLCNL